MGMGFAPTWLRHVSPPPLLHMTTGSTTPRGCGRPCNTCLPPLWLLSVDICRGL